MVFIFLFPLTKILQKLVTGRARDPQITLRCRMSLTSAPEQPSHSP